MPDIMEEDKDNFAAHRALQIAFQTMQERCHQLENRLAAVEEENVRLKVEKTNKICSDLVDTSDHQLQASDTLRSLQDKVEELTKQKSQLTHHVFMVAAENRQLWTRLTRLTRTNKSLGNKLIKISDTLKQNPNTQSVDELTFAYSMKEVPPNLPQAENIALEPDDNKDGSLEEISLRLINSIMLEKSELEQQYTEMVELQNGADINIRNVGFTYPDDESADYLQRFKQHEGRLFQTRNTLLNQQTKLKKALTSLTKIKKASKKVCQTGTQFDSDDSLRENGSTQTSLPLSSSPQLEEKFVDLTPKNMDNDGHICPICGSFFGQSVSFQTFHEHVLSHFAADNPTDFELLP